MVLPTGALVNAAAIILGSGLGMALHGRFAERFRRIVFQGLGLCVLLIGGILALGVFPGRVLNTLSTSVACVTGGQAPAAPAVADAR